MPLYVRVKQINAVDHMILDNFATPDLAVAIRHCGPDERVYQLTGVDPALVTETIHGKDAP